MTPEWFTEGFPAHVELDGELFLGRKMFGKWEYGKIRKRGERRRYFNAFVLSFSV